MALSTYTEKEAFLCEPDNLYDSTGQVPPRESLLKALWWESATFCVDPWESQQKAYDRASFFARDSP